MDEKARVESEMDMFQTIIIIQLQRIYDLLLLTVPQEEASRIRALHEAGQYLAPEPSLAPDEPE